MVLSPVIDLARDPRWGRIEETYGEDPYLVSEIRHRRRPRLPGPRACRSAPGKVFATPKHFAAHGSHEGGINTAPTLVAERELRAGVPLAVRARGQGGRRLAIMPSYNEIDGVPSHVNRWLLNDVLRAGVGLPAA